ncbi:CdaR family protein [Halobacteriovorax sp. DPLXC-1]|uniref:CdaR family protein n=1 Tax=Halobacteriovorax sp. DPLXC-1 TaxID=3110771 RepID=UPI002FF17711
MLRKIENSRLFEFLQNQFLILTSLALAVFLWFYVVNSEPIETERIYNLSVLPATSVDVTSVSAKEIHVKLKGARAFLKDFHGDDHLKFQIDLKKLKVKRNTKRIKYTIKDSDLVVPFGVEVVEISPKYVTINLDKLIYKNVPVKLNYTNNLPKDLKLISADVEPSKVRIEGARDIMRGVGLVKTRMIDLSEYTGQGEAQVELEELPDFLRYGEKNIVKFKYDIRPQKANLTLKNIPILFVAPNIKFRSRVRKVSLDVLKTGNDKIKESDIKIYADIPADMGKSANIRLRAELPDDVHLLKIHPEVIKVSR